MGIQYNKCFFNLNVFVSTQVTQQLGQNDSIFLSAHQEKKFSHFN